jgi:hypothetical protein
MQFDNEVAADPVYKCPKNSDYNFLVLYISKFKFDFVYNIVFGGGFFKKWCTFFNLSIRLKSLFNIQVFSKY